MINIFKMNDWPIRKFIILSLSLLISLDGFILLNKFGIEVPLVRQIVGFILLTFIPGYTILRVLRVHNLDEVSSLMFSIGLSMSFIMLLGLFLNLLKYFLNLGQPLNLENLLISINISYTILVFLSYKRGDNAVFNLSGQYNITLKSILFYGLILLFPILSILAGYLGYFYNIPVFEILLLIIFAFLPIYISVNGDRTKNPIFLVWSMSLSLIFLSTFGTSFNWLFIGDVNREYYVASETLKNLYWNPNMLHYNMNSMLVDAVLAPIYKIILEIPLFMVFKLIYPFLFSLVPATIYKIYTCVYNGKDKSPLFFAVFLIVSTSVFYNGMIPLTRQMIAEIYLVLILLTITMGKNLSNMHKKILSIIFGISLIVSHYGTAYIFIFSIILSFAISYMVKVPENKRIITNTWYVGLMSAFLILWYTYTSVGMPFSTLVKVLYGILVNELNKLLNPEAVQSLKIMTEKLPLLHNITKYIILISSGMIGLGVLGQITKKARIIKVDQIEFYILSLVYFGYNVLAIIVPYAKFLNIQRVYHITQLFISIYFLGGVKLLYSILDRVSCRSKSHIKIIRRKQKITVAIFLSIYLVFNSGMAYFLGNSPPIFPYFDNSVDGPRVPISNVHSALWLYLHKYPKYPVYGDFWTINFLSSFVDKNKLLQLPPTFTVSKFGYIYLRSYNLIHNQVYVSYNRYNILNLAYYNISKPPTYYRYNIIYTSSDSTILLKEGETK